MKNYIIFYIFYLIFYKIYIFFDFLSFFAGPSRGSGALREWVLRPQKWFSVIKKNQKFLAPVRPPRLCDPTPRPPRPALMSCDPTPRPPPCRDNRRNTRPAGSRDCRSTPFIFLIIVLILHFL